jgi:hypothetical protein
MSWVLLAVLAGCGGSGSSGFDPSGLEPPLIQQAIDQQRCLRGESGLVICPAGLAVPAPSSGLPSPGELLVDASVERAAGHCGAGAAPGACSLTLTVSTEGMPPGGEIRVALRAVPDGRWRVGEPLQLATAADGTATALPVTLELASFAGAADGVQVAVLLFPGPAAVPALVAELGATGATYAFVLPVLPLTGASP